MTIYVDDENEAQKHHVIDTANPNNWTTVPTLKINLTVLGITIPCAWT